MVNIFSTITGYVSNEINNTTALNIEALILFILIIFLIMIVIAIAAYIYTSFAFMAIAKKTNIKQIWLPWIPLVGKPLLSAKIAKMHWWPILLLIALPLPKTLFSFCGTTGTIIGMIITYSALITFTVFYTIWLWKVFEAVNQPGWIVLLSFIPFIGIILFYVFLGIAAWGKENIIEPRKRK